VNLRYGPLETRTIVSSYTFVYDLALIPFAMSIWNALGLGLLIIMLKVLAPAVLTQGESTALSFLKGAEVSAQVASGYAAQAAARNQPALPPYPLPQARQIGPY
jgi:hypothetical protein